MIVGSRDSAINARSLVSNYNVGGWRLEPVPLNDGTYTLPSEVLTDPNHAAANSILATWTTATPALGEYLPIPSSGGFQIVVDSKSMYHAGRRASLTMPASNVFRFEVQADDVAGAFDSTNQNRRSEIVASSQSTSGFGDGATAWSSFCFVLGDTNLATTGISGMFGFIHQWHSVDRDIGRSPGLAVDCSNNVLSIITRSSASLNANLNGIGVTQYSTALPAKGIKTYVVTQVTFGASGHLNVWINGTQVVNVNAPIGYYNDLTDGSGRTILGYPHWGLYTRNHYVTDVTYIANPECGVNDLSSRVSSPLSVPDLTW